MNRSPVFAGLCARALLSGALIAAFLAGALAQSGSTPTGRTLTTSDAEAVATSNEEETPSRPREEVLAEIDKAGKTPPEWWGSVKLEYPASLNLTWKKAGKTWNSEVNLGQHLWSYIDRNHTRGRYGAKLLTHTLSVNRDSPAALHRSMYSLGHVYADILEDWARAAFWLQKADGMGEGLPRGHKISLAECYMRLGNAEMAREILSAQRQIDARLIRLWMHAGDGDEALRLASVLRSYYRDMAYFVVGDIYRYHGWFKEAKENYRKVLQLKARRGNKREQGRFKTYKGYAGVNLETVTVFETLKLAEIPDGVYRAGCKGYVGVVSVDVTVKSGRIESITVIEEQEERKRENRALSSLVAAPRRIVEKQGIVGVDTVTGATVTSDAVMNAVVNALAGKPGATPLTPKQQKKRRRKPREDAKR